jgi:hypothetical protein
MSDKQQRIAVPPSLPHDHATAYPHVVYFIRLGNRVKIGTTRCVACRLQQFGLTWHQVALLLDDGHQLEGSLHTHFGAYRVEGTEWFRLGPPLLAYIKRYRAQAASAWLGGPEHKGTWEDINRIAYRTGLPLDDLRAWSADPTWPSSEVVRPGIRRLYPRVLVDAWLEKHQATANTTAA